MLSKQDFFQVITAPLCGILGVTRLFSTSRGQNPFASSRGANKFPCRQLWGLRAGAARAHGLCCGLMSPTHRPDLPASSCSVQPYPCLCWEGSKEPDQGQVWALCTSGIWCQWSCRVLPLPFFIFLFPHCHFCGNLGMMTGVAFCLVQECLK